MDSNTGWFFLVGYSRFKHLVSRSILSLKVFFLWTLLLKPYFEVIHGIFILYVVGICHHFHTLNVYVLINLNIICSVTGSFISVKLQSFSFTVITNYPTSSQTTIFFWWGKCSQVFSFLCIFILFVGLFSSLPWHCQFVLN